MDTAAVLRAAYFAATKHSKQRRLDKDQSPYINHPLQVAYLLANVGGVTDAVTLQAALLHDTVEDVGVTFDELEREFGREVSNVVAEVTDDKQLNKVQRKKLQIEHAAHCSTRAKLVKLGDKLSNLSCLVEETPMGWDAKRVQGYFVWSWFIVEGLRGTNAAMEAALDRLFAGEFCDPTTGKRFPVLPVGTKPETAKEEELLAHLEAYYEQLRQLEK